MWKAHRTVLVVPLLIGGAGIACVALGGSGVDGAMVILGGALAVALLGRPVGWVLDRKRLRQDRRAAGTTGQGETGRC